MERSPRYESDISKNSILRIFTGRNNEYVIHHLSSLNRVVAGTWTTAQETTDQGEITAQGESTAQAESTSQRESSPDAFFKHVVIFNQTIDAGPAVLPHESNVATETQTCETIHITEWRKRVCAFCCTFSWDG